jgi:hypothetical protein
MSKVEKLLNIILILLTYGGIIVCFTGNFHLVILLWAWPAGWAAGVAISELLIKK